MKTVQSRALLVFLFLGTIANYCKAQVEPDLGDTLFICQGRTDTVTIAIENALDIEFNDSITQDSIFAYSWVIYESGTYLLIDRGMAPVLSAIPNLELPLSRITHSTIIRLEILDSSGENYLVGDKVIDVMKPYINGLPYEFSMCRNQEMEIIPTKCNYINKPPYTFTLVYSEPFDTAVYGDTILSTTEDTFLLVPRNIDDYPIIIDGHFKFKMYVTDSDGVVQVSDEYTVKIINMGRPGLQVAKYIIGNNPILIKPMLETTDTAEYRYVWYKFRDSDSSFVQLAEKTSILTTNDSGLFSAFVYRYDSIIDLTCGEFTSAVRVYKIPEAGIHIQADTFKTDPGSGRVATLFIDNLYHLDTGFIILQWYKTNEFQTYLDTLKEETHSVIKVLNAGYYFVCLYTEDTILVSNQIYIESSGTGLNTIMRSKPSIIAFPNPTTGIISIVSTGKLYSEGLELELVDAVGRTVLKNSYLDVPDCVLDLSLFADGVYMLRIRFSESGLMETTRIIKNTE